MPQLKFYTFCKELLINVPLRCQMSDKFLISFKTLKLINYSENIPHHKGYQCHVNYSLVQSMDNATKTRYSSLEVIISFYFSFL